MAKQKRKSWAKTKAPKEKQPKLEAKYCDICGRKFYPRTESTTCILCKEGLTVGIEALIKAETPTQNSEPNPASGRKSKQANQTKRVCLRCQKDFMSDGIYNRICKNCQGINASIPADMGDQSIGEIYITKDM